MILIIPFFLLEFLNGFFGSIMQFCCQQAFQKGLNAFNLIFFLGTTDRSRILGLDVARVFCGSIFQLILQVVLVLGLTPWRSVRTSQLVSIASSLLCIIKTNTEVLTFKDEETKVPDTRTTCEKVKDFFMAKMELVRNMFQLFPVLAFSIIFNVGTIGLSYAVLGIYSFIFVILSFLSHIATFFLVPLPNSLDHKMLTSMGIEQDSHAIRPAISKLPTALLLAWKNIFILSCNTGTSKAHRTITILYIQVARFLSNVCLLAIILACYGFNANFKTVGIISGILIFCGIIFLSLACSSTTWLEMQQEQKVEGQVEKVEEGLVDEKV